MKKKILFVLAVCLLAATPSAFAAEIPKKMHPSWDLDKDGINDCEKDGSCDDSVDYSLPRGEDIVSYRENFYKAVNRDWLKSHEIRGDQASVSNFSLLIDKVNEELKTILENLEKKQNLSGDKQKILDFYRSYVNTEQREKLGTAPLAKDLEQIEKAESHKDVALLFAEFSKIRVVSPMFIAPTIDKKKSTNYLFAMSQSGLGLLKDDYSDQSEHGKKERSLYKNYMQQLLELGNFADAKDRAERVLALESRLAAIQWSGIENRIAENTYNIGNLKELDASLPNLALAEQFKVLQIDKEVKISIYQPSYFKGLNELFTETDLDTWKDYLRVRYLRGYGDYTVQAFEDIYSEYKKSRGLADQPPPMWQRGIEQLNNVLPMLVGKIYVENFFDEASIPVIEKLVQDIIHEYELAITKSTLFSKATRDKALEKLHAMKFNIGHPKKWRDYSTLVISKDDLVANLKNIAQLDYAEQLRKASKPVDREMWDTAPQTVNAFYSPPMNKFVLLAAILDKPFFDAQGSEAHNYGGIGFVIAHEVGHGFDDQGSQYDYNGNLVNWWTSGDREKYNLLKQQLISQADHFEYLPGKHLKGALEVGEIIGDLNGAEIALRAYTRIIEAKKLNKDESLKEFFSQMGKTWRNKTRPHRLEMIVNMDSHPVGEFRVNGILKNLDTFHEVYQTQAGDGMYLAPDKRVKLW